MKLNFLQGKLSLKKAFVALSVVILSLATVACGSGGGGNGGSGGNGGNSGKNPLDQLDKLHVGKSCYNSAGMYGEGYVDNVGGVFGANYINAGDECFGVPTEKQIGVFLVNHANVDLTQCFVMLEDVKSTDSINVGDIVGGMDTNSNTYITTSSSASNGQAGNRGSTLTNGHVAYTYVQNQQQNDPEYQMFRTGSQIRASVSGCFNGGSLQGEGAADTSTIITIQDGGTASIVIELKPGTP